MHYLIFSANYLPNIGGVERFTEGLSRGLAGLGHSVTIVTSNVFGLAAFETLGDGVDIVRLPCHPCLKGRMPLPKRDAEFRRAWRRLLALPADGVLINTRFYMHTLLGLRLAKENGLRPVILDHGSAYLTFGSKALDVFVRLYEDGITALVKRHDADFYGISNASVRWLAHFGIEAKGVIGNSIDAAAYRAQASSRDFRRELGIPEDRLMVAFTGRFIPEKGVDSLIAAMELLADRPISLVMAGDGSLRQKIEDKNLENVYVVGRLDQPDIAALLMQSGLFCLPTRSEGFSTSLLEASACGTPSLMPAVGGVAELIPDESFGTVLPDTKPETIAKYLDALSSERDVLERQGENCVALVERSFSWRATASLVSEALARAAAGRR